MWRQIGSLCIVMLTATSMSRRLDADRRLAIDVTPSVAVAPATLRVRVDVEPARENRSLEIVLESESFFRSSELSLDGEAAPRESRVDYHDLPIGNYTIRAIVTAGNDQHIAEKQVTIIR
jgi:hypothetical protein